MGCVDIEITDSTALVRTTVLPVSTTLEIPVFSIYWSNVASVIASLAAAEVADVASGAEMASKGVSLYAIAFKITGTSSSTVGVLAR